MFDGSLQSALDVFCYALVLVYGLALSAEISTGGSVSQRQRRVLALLCLAFLLVQALGLLLLSERTVRQLYPLIVHLPLVLILIFFMQCSVGVAIVSACTAYLCCQPPRWVRITVEALTGSEAAAALLYLLLLPVMYWLLRRYFVGAVYSAMTASHSALLLFGSLPAVYYIFDYATTIYSNALYAGIAALNEFLPTALVTFYILFLPTFQAQAQRRADAEVQRSMVESALEQSMQEVETLRRLEAQTAIYQHDMRHHLNMLDGLLKAGKPEKAEEYIHRVQADISAITPQHFCENELVNLLCSDFTSRAQAANTVLTVEAHLPEAMGISDTELCSLLGNGLENALCAVEELPVGQRRVSLYCGVRRNKLLIEIRNPYRGKVMMQDGVPVNTQEGHGLGCRSIRAVAERHDGLCVFSAQSGEFYMRVMLPVLESE